MNEDNVNKIREELKGFISSDPYHSSRCLSRAPHSPFKKILLIGSCQLGQFGIDNNKNFSNECDFILHNNAGELQDIDGSVAAEYDFQVIQIGLRFLTPDSLFWKLSYGDLKGHEEAFELVCKKLDLYLSKVMKHNMVHGLLTFVTNFLVPQKNPMGDLLPKYDLRNPAYFIQRMNEYLESNLKKYKNAFMLDIDGLSSIFGKRYVQDDSMQWLSHGALMPGYHEDRSRLEIALPLNDHFENKTSEFRKIVQEQIIALYKVAHQKDQVKLVVVDLDDSLWRGIIGEIDDPNASLVEGWPLGVVEALAYLKKRGVMLAIISKNDDEYIRKVWPKIFYDRLNLNDFAMTMINYEPKAVNMTSILQSVNVLPSSVVYIDDNPVERESIKKAFPGIRVLPRFHYFWRKILLWSPETQPRELTSEALRKTEMMQAQVARESLKGQLTREEFLRSLQVKLNFFEVGGSEDLKYPRVFELLNKTNQFNTNGKRWTPEEVAKGFATGLKIYAFDVNDNFTDYGLVGVILCSGPEILQMVMSCRVAGLDVEIAAIAKLIDEIRKSVGQDAKIEASYHSTSANMMCKDLWDKCGFQKLGEQKYLFKSDSILSIPNHIYAMTN
ncbi:HAD-IIIC family phosphatase [Polynucleobacter paneuropaeus]|nr:HAD-IIIC family phosphatase [Polynucleobacter paneuropaeus]